MNYIGKNNPNYKHGIYCNCHRCLVCSKKISLNSVLYGSHKCKSCARIGKKAKFHRNYKRNCIDCNKEIDYRSMRCISCRSKYTTKKRNFLIGKQNPNWKGGITKLDKKIRNSQQYKKIINSVFKRDNYICQKCGKLGNKLHVHHKLLFSFIIKLYNLKTFNQALKCKLLWDINWLITLCDKCHQYVHPEYNIKRKIYD